jgi:hypothetical protein
MPLGNGDVAINAWVLQSGDLVFYVAKSDAFGGKSHVPYPMKLGRVRVSLSPNPFASRSSFAQTLALDKGEMIVKAGNTGASVTLTLWVDANSPTVRLQAHGDQAFQLTAALETWRTDDVVMPAANNAVTWYHRDATSPWMSNLSLQMLGSWPSTPGVTDPILNRTFGGTIAGMGLVSKGNNAIASSAPATDFAVDVHVLTSMAATPADWLTALQQQVMTTEATPIDQARMAHESWWNAFWGRSWIALDESGGANQALVNQGYLFQRFMLAAEGRSGMPIKFNGGQFTVTGTGSGGPNDKWGITEAAGTPDYRAWGGGYWFQNTRLMYWAMLASGDFDEMQPFFKTYHDALPLRLAQTKALFNHGGAFYPETMNFWGTYNDAEYMEQTPYIWKHYNGTLELVALMFDYFDYTGDMSFAQNVLFPTADAVIAFFEQHFSKNSMGVIDMPNGQALETYWPPTHNPTPDIAGLQWDLDELLALPAGVAPAAMVTHWQSVRAVVPPLPMGMATGGGQVIAPALPPLGMTHNTEDVQLYPVFPYRIFGVGKANLSDAVTTYTGRPFKSNKGWNQDLIWAAYLGQGSDASMQIVQRFQATATGSRFPGFYGPNYDWTPDQQHGSNAMTALQRMLIQPDGGKIRLFTAWPMGWDVDFRLHAPGNTVVEGTLKGGALQRISVTPAARYGDVEAEGGITLPPNGASSCP